MANRSPINRLIVVLSIVAATLALVAGAGAQLRPSLATSHSRHSADLPSTAKHHSGHHSRRHKVDAQPANKRATRRVTNPKTAVAGTSTVKAPAAPTSQAGAGAPQASVAGGTQAAGAQAGVTATTAAGAQAVVTATAAARPQAAAERFYVYPRDSAVIEENALLAAGDKTDAAQIEKIASQPEGIWLTSDGSVSIVPGIMSAAASNGTVPVFVVYNIPGRDCGGYSSGGAAGATDYEAFINSIVAGLGQGKAILIVEPDALTNLAAGCTSMGSDASLIAYAAQHLDTDANASVYVDAGNPGWEPAAAEAKELQQVLGSTKAGFAINVSNFVSTAKDIAYGTAISQASGGRHFVVDTSRNGGSVASGAWCNPAGAGIGVDPTAVTGNPLVDAFLWIKDVGNSDGTCNGGPPAGQFWLSYALSLVANG